MAKTHEKTAFLPPKTLPPRGVEPLDGNAQVYINKELTENETSVLASSLDKVLETHPELEAVIHAWPQLPEQTKAAIKALIQITQSKVRR